MTNADNIRNMSDEELAAFLIDSPFCCEYGCPAQTEDCYSGCKEATMVWLQKKVEK